MGLAFSLTLPADTTFISVEDIPKLTASAICPESDSGFDLHELKSVGCTTNHEAALERAIKDRAVTLLNPLSFESHTFPFGDARKKAVISIADFKRFAATLQISVRVENEPEDFIAPFLDTKIDLQISVRVENEPEVVRVENKPEVIEPKKSKPKEKNAINQDWQSEMDRMAAELIQQKKKSLATKRKLAKTLSLKIDIDSATIERQTRKNW